MSGSSLDALFRPRSVAIVGASTDPNKIGGRPIHFLKKGGYAGEIFPVNPRADEVQGLPAYPSLDAIGAPVDQAVIALPADAVDGAVEAALAAGARGLIVFSAGFGEAGAEGRARQQVLADKARSAGARLLGPNSLGLFNAHSGLFSTFATALDGAWPAPGKVGIATQSGAFGSYCFAIAAARGLGVSHFVATGNEADIDVADCIDFMADDPDTQVIVCALEAARDGARLVASLDRARAAGKPVIAMKVGTSEAGVAAAASHTGSLVGEAQVYDAVFRQTGAYQAHSIEDMVDVAYAASVGVLPGSERTGIITTSGGVGVLLADAVADRGLDLAELPASAQAAIRDVLPLASGRNPVDSTAQILSDMSLFTRILEIMVDAGSFASIVVYLAHIGRNPDHFAQIKPALLDIRARYPETLFVLCMLADGPVRHEMEAAGFPVFEDPNRAVG